MDDKKMWEDFCERQAAGQIPFNNDFYLLDQPIQDNSGQHVQLISPTAQQVEQAKSAIKLNIIKRKSKQRGGKTTYKGKQKRTKNRKIKRLKKKTKPKIDKKSMKKKKKTEKKQFNLQRKLYKRK